MRAGTGMASFKIYAKRYLCEFAPSNAILEYEGTQHWHTNNTYASFWAFYLQEIEIRAATVDIDSKDHFPIVVLRALFPKNTFLHRRMRGNLCEYSEGASVLMNG